MCGQKIITSAFTKGPPTYRHPLRFYASRLITCYRNPPLVPLNSITGIQHV
uniref:Uncharacterized protein n=1 Tax=Arundo donax TaxID=35708 RepID=A0A0A8ZAK2_ARUDO